MLSTTFVLAAGDMSKPEDRKELSKKVRDANETRYPR